MWFRRLTFAGPRPGRGPLPPAYDKHGKGRLLEFVQLALWITWTVEGPWAFALVVAAIQMEWALNEESIPAFAITDIINLAVEQATTGLW